MIPTPNQRCDVVVVGGGPAGAICATLLARRALTVLLIDHGRSGVGIFPETLSPAGQRALEGLQIPFDSDKGRPCRRIEACWQSTEPEVTEVEWLRCRPGLSLDRAAFDRGLRALAESEGTWVLEARATHLDVPAEGAVTLEIVDRGGTRRLECSALIDATGRKGIPGTLDQRIYFDRLVAVTRPVSRGCVAEQLRLFASEHGWWYVAEHPRGPIAVFLTDGDLLPRDNASRDDHLAAELSRIDFPITLERDLAATPRDARTSCRRQLTRGGWFPIGDAAYSVDPLSGSGLDNAIRSASRAAAATVEYLRTGDRRPFTDAALAVSREISEMLSEQARNYAVAAARFPGSAFWTRRTLKEMQ